MGEKLFRGQRVCQHLGASTTDSGWRRARLLRSLIILLLATLIVSAIGACGEGTEKTGATDATLTGGAQEAPSTSSSGSAAIGSEKSIRVGVLADYSLPLLLDFANMIKALVPKVNEAGGLTIAGEKYKVELFVYDGKSDADAARSAVQRMITKDKVQFVLGDATIDYWQPLTEEAKVIAIVGAPSQNMFDPKYRYSFQTAEFSSTRPATWLWAAEKFPQFKTVCAAFPDALPGHIDSGELEKMCKYTGQKIVKSLFYPQGTTDFSAIAAALVDSNADVFTTAGGGAIQDPLLQKAMNQAGFKGQQLMLTNICLPGILTVVSPQDVEGTLGGIQATDLPNPPAAAQELMKVYTETYGEWNNPAIGWISTWYMLKAALEKTPSLDPDAVADTIAAGIEFECPGGRVKMVSRPDLGNSRAVDACYDRYIGYIRNGQWEVVEYLTPEQSYDLIKAFYGW